MPDAAGIGQGPGVPARSHTDKPLDAVPSARRGNTGEVRRTPRQKRAGERPEDANMVKAATVADQSARSNAPARARRP